MKPIPEKWHPDSTSAILLAADRRFTKDPVENLCRYVREGDGKSRRLAIDGLGHMRDRSCIEFLISVLKQCEVSIRMDTPFAIGDSTDYPFPIAASILETLAKLDCVDAHAEIVRVANSPNKLYLRAAAIEATGWEGNFHDEGLIRRYIDKGNHVRLRVGAMWAIFETTGPRLASYKPLVFPFLQDASPIIVISAIEILVLFMYASDELQSALHQLRDDRRYCRLNRTTVGKFATLYLQEA